MDRLPEECFALPVYIVRWLGPSETYSYGLKFGNFYGVRFGYFNGSPVIRIVDDYVDDEVVYPSMCELLNDWELPTEFADIR